MGTGQVHPGPEVTGRDRRRGEVIVAVPRPDLVLAVVDPQVHLGFRGQRVAVRDDVPETVRGGRTDPRFEGDLTGDRQRR